MAKITFPTINLIAKYFDDHAIKGFLKTEGCVKGEIELYSKDPGKGSWYYPINFDDSKPMYKMMKSMNPVFMGIDIPVLISKPENTKTVMLIGRDPQRNKNQAKIDMGGGQKTTYL